MNYSRLTVAAMLLAVALSACDRKTETTVVQPVPVPGTPPVVVSGPPGPAGPPGPTGAQGEPGKGGNTTVIVPAPAAEEKK